MRNFEFENNYVLKFLTKRKRFSLRDKEKNTYKAIAIDEK